MKHKHCRYTIDVRSEDGSVIAQYECDPSSLQCHHTRDVAALALDADASAVFSNATLESQLFAANLSSSPLTSANLVTVAGHAIVMHSECDQVRDDASCEGGTSNEDGRRLQLPEAISGCSFVTRFGSKQAFIRTPHVLEEGMCGGGVFGESVDNSDTCYGWSTILHLSIGIHSSSSCLLF